MGNQMISCFDSQDEEQSKMKKRQFVNKNKLSKVPKLQLSSNQMFSERVNSSTRSTNQEEIYQYTY